MTYHAPMEATVAAFVWLDQLWRVVKIGQSYFVRDARDSDTGPFSTVNEARDWVLAIVPVLGAA